VPELVVIISSQALSICSSKELSQSFIQDRAAVAFNICSFEYWGLKQKVSLKS